MDAGVGVGFPAGAGFFDFRCAGIGAEDVEAPGIFSEDIGEDACFVGAAAGEIEKTAVFGPGERVAALAEGFRKDPMELSHVGIGADVGKIGLLELAHLS